MKRKQDNQELKRVRRVMGQIRREEEKQFGRNRASSWGGRPSHKKVRQKWNNQGKHMD